MRYLTDRKRAEGLGSAGQGTHHHWQMMVGSIGLVLLMPFFIFVFGMALGGTREEVIAFFSRPFPAVLTALTLFVAISHFKREAQEAVEDYVHGTTGKLLHMAVGALAWTTIAAGLFALVRLAL